MSERRGPWTIKARREIYENSWIRITEHDVLNPNGNAGIYGVVGLQNIAIGVLPIDREGRTWLVGQHRFPGDYYSWELPEGGGAKDIAPEESARRELLEETGLRAGGLEPFLRMDLSNAVTDETAIGFLAWDLTQDQPMPDDDEQIEIRRLPYREVLEMALSGEIVDAFSQAMLMKAELLRLRGALPEPLAEALGR